MRFKVEEKREIDDYVIVCIMTDMGHRCGYVGIGEKHKLYKVPYNQNKVILKKYIDSKPDEPIGKRGIIPLFCNNSKRGISADVAFDVHGSITYSNNGDYPILLDKPVWWFGFDCAHDGDAKDLSYIDDSKSREFYAGFNNGIVRSKEYVIQECESLVNQLKEVNQI